MYNEGISLAGDLIDTGVEFGVVKKSGNSYSYGDEKLGMGRENAKMSLKERPDMMKEIREKVIAEFQTREASLGGSSRPPEGDADEEVPPLE